MHNRSSNVVVYIEVKIKVPNGSTFKTFIQSMWFSEEFILTGDLPSGTRAYIFEEL